MVRSQIDLNDVISKLCQGGINYVEFFESTGTMRKTLNDVKADVTAVASAFKKMGLPAHAHIGIVGSTNYQWLIVDLACLAEGFFTVPFDPEVGWERSHLAERFELQLIVTDDPNYTDVGCQVIVFDDICSSSNATEDLTAYRWDASEAFTTIFSSGTTGVPKAIKVRKKYFDDQFSAASEMFDVGVTDTMLVFLPMHIYLERCYIYLAILRGFSVAYAPPRFIAKALRTTGFTFTVGVPYFFSSLQDLFLNGIKAHRLGMLLLRFRMLAFRLGLGFLIARPFRPFQQMLGGKARLLLTGSAPCPLPTLEFYHAMGIPLYEGYGMSEIAGMIALNYPKNVKLGTVGKVFPKKQVKIDSEGQILVRGEVIEDIEYWRANDDDAATTFLSDGWIATGDIGRCDNEGYISIDGRIKDLIVLSNGRKISPGPIEAQINAIPGVDQSVVIGNNRAYIVALVSWKDHVLDKRIFADRLLQLNNFRPAADGVKKYAFLGERFTMDNGFLNRSLKLNRRYIEEYFANLIEELYS